MGSTTFKDVLVKKIEESRSIKFYTGVCLLSEDYSDLLDESIYEIDLGLKPGLVHKSEVSKKRHTFRYKNLKLAYMYPGVDKKEGASLLKLCRGVYWACVESSVDTSFVRVLIDSYEGDSVYPYRVTVICSGVGRNRRPVRVGMSKEAGLKAVKAIKVFLASNPYIDSCTKEVFLESINRDRFLAEVKGRDIECAGVDTLFKSLGGIGVPFTKIKIKNGDSPCLKYGMGSILMVVKRKNFPIGGEALVKRFIKKVSTILDTGDCQGDFESDFLDSPRGFCGELLPPVDTVTFNKKDSKYIEFTSVDFVNKDVDLAREVICPPLPVIVNEFKKHFSYKYFDCRVGLHLVGGTERDDYAISKLEVTLVK